jgi:metal-responsive CopG/Arc/MetJ family transcriptional regulator
MTPRRVTAFRLDDELLEGLQQVWERDGVQPSEQVRRAIRAWLETKNVDAKKKTANRRASTRRKA